MRLYTLIVRGTEMTIEQLQAAIHATPFRPFTVRMADGRAFPVPHPDFIAHAGRTAVIVEPDGGYHVVDLLLMTELEGTRPSTSDAQPA
jgi:hypothetical protein